MGALDVPVPFRDVHVTSGDVVAFTPRGFRRWLHRPFLAVIDVRDRSIPYAVIVHRGRAWKLPLEHPRFSSARADARVFRVADLEPAACSTIAARAAERPGEGVHHPSYDCGRAVASDAALVEDAYAAAGVSVAIDPAAIGPPFTRVLAGTAAEARSADRGSGRDFLERGVPKSLPWQKRSKR